MQRRSIIWIIAVAICLLGGWCVWHWAANESAPGRNAEANRPAIATANPTAAPGAILPGSAGATNRQSAVGRSPADYLLSNTTRPYESMIDSDTAVLLENARVDTTLPATLSIPDHLKAKGEPGAYIVQAQGLVDDAFRTLLKQSGVTPVSYIPNNAWLVQASSAQVQWLAAQGKVRATVAFEPYFKLKSALLPFAVEQTPLPVGAYLNVMLFDGARADTVKALADMGVKLISEVSSPFGSVLTVQPRPQSLAAIASLPGVQLVERAAPRVEANDLSRVKVSVSSDTVVETNYFGLTGAGVMVAVADSGVDMTHPDLTGRVFPDIPAAGVDTVGHGTHVAATIAGDGSASLATPLTDVPGSVDGADFRGKAPGANLYAIVQSLSPTNGLGSDAYSQQQAALTNALISNNSWGYLGDNEYSIAAASFDAAVRDALPYQPGSQPVTFVFAGGNEGGGNDAGQSGIAGSIRSPATGKNVITVGGLEQLRNITNEVYFPPSTNRVATWETQTDSDSEVGSYSSRGNVGIGTEGIYGRFKPDVVAPGTWVVSARSAQWDEDAYYSITNQIRKAFNDLVLPVDKLDQFSISVPQDAVQVQISVTAENPVVDLPIYVRAGTEKPTTNLYDFVGTNQVTLPPDLPLTAFSNYRYAIGNPTNVPVTYNIETITTVTNDLENYYEVLKQLNDALGGDYRYETGTSMAAPTVSGMLALMHQYYQEKLGRTNSPALMKALLINGARVASSLYDLQVETPINHQGWGLVNLPTSLPSTTAGVSTNGPTAFTFYDQDPNLALATGQSHTRTLVLGNTGVGRFLRCTLVWTDPAGNPAAGIKLVNDLDLVVTNLDTGEVYVGNNFLSGNGFTSESDTNAPASPDRINNVENVFLADPTNGTYSVTVIGRRVNANAVTAHTNNVVQDYALVITSGDGEVTDAFAVTVDGPIVTGVADNVTVITNTVSPVPLLNQTVGANSPLIQALNGITNQWHFYVATNYGTNANFTNAAFITFLPPTLSVPRLGPWSPIDQEISRPEADIDMYVSTLAGLTNLDQAVLNDPATVRAVGRGGTEVITFSNSAPDKVYYIGVKSEDQMAGQYGFFGLFSDRPFSERDAEGNQIIYGTPVPAIIPDGDNANPGAVLVFGIAVLPDKIRKVSVTNTLTHELMGDLFGNLSHNNSFVVLNNHTAGNGDLTQMFIYDDSGGAGTKQPDGPGSLQDFVTQEAVGLWLLTMLDDGPGATGRVESLTIKVEPQNIEEGDRLTIPPFGWGYTFVEVPVEATNLTIELINNSANPLPVDLYVRRGALPTFLEYDKKATINPPGGTLTIGKADLPPLEAGIYYIGVYNPNAEVQRVTVKATLELDIDGLTPLVFASTNAVPIFDDAVTNTFLTVTNDQRIARLEVGLRVNHPRVSDLAFQLVSPEGTRVLLFENRGGLDTNGLGTDIVSTNALLTGVNGTSSPTNLIVPAVTNGTLYINYSFVDATNAPATNSIAIYAANTNRLFGPVTNSVSGSIAIPITPNAGPFEIRINEDGSFDTNTTWTVSAYAVSLDGFLYATFTEDTNKVSDPESLLKFVTPPFTVPNPSNLLVNVYSNGIYYLPEESLDAVKGENAKGDWTLEMWDSRVGATNPAPELLSWNLSLILEQLKLPFIVLEPFVTITSTVPAGQFEYLVVDVPSWALAATNSLLSATDLLSVWFNQDGAPTGVAPPDTLFYGGPVTNGVATLTTNGVPPLLPGQRYYLGVQNTNAVAVTYTFRVDFDITALTNGVPYVAVTASNGVPRYFSYDVSTNASAVLFELFGLDGDVNLIASRGRLPTRQVNDYFSFNTGTNDEAILVFTNGSPVALQPGAWYLGVLNATTAVVNYTIQATEFTNAFPQIVTLTNAIPYANSSAATPGTAQYYRYLVTTNAARVQFEIFGATGDFTLVASKGLPLPDLFNFDYRSANPGTNDEVIVVITNSLPVNLTSGDWFITAVKISGGAADYSIMATEWSTTAFPVKLVSSGVAGTDYCLTWASLPGVHYFVQGKTSLMAPNWITISPTITADANVTTWCIPLPTPYTVFRVVEGVVISPSPPLPTVITGFNVSPGLVILSWYGPLNANYRVEWTDSLSPVNWQVAGPAVNNLDGTFSFTDDGSTTAPFGGSRHYRIIQLP